MKATTENWRLVTFNIQYAAERRWLGKREALAGLLAAEGADVVCLQEVSGEGLVWLAERLGAQAMVGVGRDDGIAGGEHVPILVMNPAWQVRDSGTFWLSPTPESPSRGWGAAHPRICTWARVRRGREAGDLLVANVHLDHRSRVAREESVRLLQSRLGPLRREADAAVLCGDFNFRDRSQAYAILTAGPGRWIDAGAVAGRREPTWDGWGIFPVGRGRIDYVFLDPEMTLGGYAVRPNRVDRRRVSDHHPVVVDLGG